MRVLKYWIFSSLVILVVMWSYFYYKRRSLRWVRSP